MNVGASFAADATIYDRSRCQLIPCFDDFYGVAVEQATHERADALQVLDLGAGTGLLSAFFADAFPNARFTLVDAAAEMLDRARERFARDAGRFRCLTLDYATESLPGAFDLVISCLSIHHLRDVEKAGLFGRIHEALRSGGAFINADQVLGETPAVDARNRAAWLAGVHRLGVSPSDLHAAQQRMTHDRPATLADQLGWLTDAGFCEVNCAYKNGMFVVYSGRR